MFWEVFGLCDEKRAIGHVETSYILKGKNREIVALKLEVKAEIIKVDIQ